MNADPLDLAGLLAARLCHDLAGPVGALVNGAELVADEPDPDIRNEFIGMIAGGAAAVGARVRFHRLTFGGTAGGPDMKSAEARGVLEGLLAVDKRLALDWQVAGDTLPRDDARLLLALALIASEAAEGAGTLTVSDTGVRMTASRVALDRDSAAVLGGEGLAPGARSTAASALFAVALAARTGAALMVDAGADVLRIRIAA